VHDIRVGGKIMLPIVLSIKPFC